MPRPLRRRLKGISNFRLAKDMKHALLLWTLYLGGIRIVQAEHDAVKQIILYPNTERKEMHSCLQISVRLI